MTYFLTMMPQHRATISPEINSTLAISVTITMPVSNLC